MNKRTVNIEDWEIKIKEHVSFLETGIQDQKLELIDMRVENITTSNLKLPDAAFIRCTFDHCHFSNCDFMGSIWIGSQFKNCTFLSCNFLKAELNEVQSENIDFNGCNFTRANLNEGDFKKANFENCNFSWSWLLDSDLRNTNLENTDFTGARFGNTKLYNPEKFLIKSFKDAKLEDIDFSEKGDRSKIVNQELVNFISK